MEIRSGSSKFSRSLKSSKLQKTSKGQPWTIPPHPPYNGDLERKSTGCVYIYYILQSGFHIKQMSLCPYTKFRAPRSPLHAPLLKGKRLSAQRRESPAGVSYRGGNVVYHFSRWHVRAPCRGGTAAQKTATSVPFVAQRATTRLLSAR